MFPPFTLLALKRSQVDESIFITISTWSSPTFTPTKKHGDSTWSCTLLCQPTWNGMLVWFEQITKFESKQWNMTGMLPAISNYYHHLWVFLSHLCLWSWLCHVNHQSLKGSTCRRFYRHLCVLDATVFGLGEDQPWRHETTAVFAPQHEIDVHTPGSGPKPCFPY